MTSKIVLTWTHSNGVDSWDHTLPVEYESIEAAYVDFEYLCLEAASLDLGTFKFYGFDFSVVDFFEQGRYYPPYMYTVEEWFEFYGGPDD